MVSWVSYTQLNSELEFTIINSCVYKPIVMQKAVGFRVLGWLV